MRCSPIDTSLLVVNEADPVICQPLCRLWRCSRRYLERAFKQLLAQVHPGKRGIQLAKHSQARYRVQGQPNTKSLQKGLEVYDRWKSSKEQLWKIGNDLPGIIRTQKIKPAKPKGEEMLKRRALAATVRRYISRVEQTIERVEQGIFP